MSPAVYTRDKGAEAQKKDVPSSSKGNANPSSSAGKEENDATSEVPVIDKYERKKAKKQAKKQKELFYKIAREAAAKAALLYFQKKVASAAKELEKRTMKTRVFGAWDDWAS